MRAWGDDGGARRRGLDRVAPALGVSLGAGAGGLLALPVGSAAASLVAAAVGAAVGWAVAVAVQPDDAWARAARTRRGGAVPSDGEQVVVSPTAAYRLGTTDTGTMEVREFTPLA